MSSYFWYQRTGGEEAWHSALSEHRSKVIAELKPAFVTVLNASVIPEQGWSREQYDAVKYSGPFYVDWDAETLEEAITGFHQFLAKLKESNVDLSCLRLYATGGRGFHLEMPEEVFMPKVPRAGVAHLPAIYKEMAWELFVDTMDTKVYTARKGRMWRTPGIKRPNDLYKVPLTVEQALTITPEDYNLLCAEPRLEPERSAPTLSTTLASLYSSAADKVQKGVKNRGKSSKDLEKLGRFKGEFPNSVKRIMAGEGLQSGIGFNRVALQLAIVANTLGKTQDQFVASCQGLIENHVSDGRYNSPRKRKQALRDLWNYTNESDTYTYSAGGIKSLVTPDFPTGDLDGIEAHALNGYVPDSVEEEDDEFSNAGQDFAADIANASSTLNDQLVMTRAGIYRRTAEGFKCLSNIGFVRPAVLVDAEDLDTLGLEVDLISDNKPIGRHQLQTKTFQSRASLNLFCSGRDGVFTGTDQQANVLQLALQRKAKEKKRVIYVVRREGLDIVQNPTERSKVDLDVLWSGNDGVITHREGIEYAFQARIASNQLFDTDIHLCKPLYNSQNTRDWLKALLTMNEPTVVAQMLGWFVSCMHKQFYQRKFKQYPLLHPNGPAGSGKTLTTELLGRMYHNTTRPKVMAAATTSKFSLKGLWSASASIPLIIEEYKPSEMDASQVNFLTQHLRLAYNQGTAATGGVSKGSADSSFRDITEFSLSAPTVYMGEAQEMQTALVQRSIPVHLHPEVSRKYTPSFDLAMAGADYLPMLGRVLLSMTMGMRDGDRWMRQPETLDSRGEALAAKIKDLRAVSDRSIHPRQVYNLSVILAGLEYLDEALELIFGSEFKGEIERLTASIYDHKSDIQVQVMSEAAKVFNDMSLMSRTEPEEGEFAFREGFEYILTEDYIELPMREAFLKYFSWAKRKGMSPLYGSAESFIAAMTRFPATYDRVCSDSPFRRDSRARIFRFNLQKLYAEGVEGFKSKLLD